MTRITSKMTRTIGTENPYQMLLVMSAQAKWSPPPNMLAAVMEDDVGLAKGQPLQQEEHWKEASGDNSQSNPSCNRPC